MRFVGLPKQTATGVVFLSGLNTFMTIQNTFGAVGLILRFSGGSANNALATGCTVVGSYDGTTTPGGASSPIMNFATAMTNITLAASPACVQQVFFGTDGSNNVKCANLGCQFPFLFLSLQAQTGNVTGVLVEAWVVFDAPPAYFAPAGQPGVM